MDEGNDERRARARRRTTTRIYRAKSRRATSTTLHDPDKHVSHTLIVRFEHVTAIYDRVALKH